MNSHTPAPLAHLLVDSVGPPVGRELTSLALTGQCKYPVHSTGRHHLFCGKPATGSWCREHEKDVWIPLSHYRGRKPR